MGGHLSPKGGEAAQGLAEVGNHVGKQNFASGRGIFLTATCQQLLCVNKI